ncbi:hypothetical protein RR46_04304 [Papilio xuthus]|uniref:Uncharacterized protein n=1 Tax=Papilio xuthus TaxID=66420 RepID=A0A194QDZ1_PAPXU|nr:hypothetical protein RR46_04304 [Papilio xuthus]
MSWYSKKDVLKDLAQAMGGKLKDIDEQHIVVGEQPPPICTMTEDDDELLLRLKQGLAQDDRDRAPDLAGITEMLRMVDDFDESECKENKCTQQDNNNTVISISKLNPVVPEFIPKKSNDQQPEKVETSNKNGIKKVETSSNTSEDIKEISERLKIKIISPTNENVCIKMKSERNIAIASLLKLYSDPPETCGIDEKQPKLLTPQHFEMPYVENTKVKDVLPTSSNLANEIVNECETREDRNMKQEVDNSVAKVKSWLNMNEKPKTLTKALFLGPVTFKKKENVKPITPTSEVSEKTSSDSPSYVPTEYAEKLTETYKMRVKAKEEQSLDMWSRLERDLKAKDEDIRRRNLQATQSTTKSRGRRRHQHAN